MQSYIVYRSDIELSSAVATAYELGSIDMTKEAGLYLRNVILEHFFKSEELKWPPTAQDLGSMHDILPEQLEKFLRYVIGGREISKTTKIFHLIQSIGQDICRAATSGAWKMPKHMLICMILRHLLGMSDWSLYWIDWGTHKNIRFL